MAGTLSVTRPADVMPGVILFALATLGSYFECCNVKHVSGRILHRDDLGLEGRRRAGAR